MPQHEFYPRAPRLPLRAPVTVRTSPSTPWAEGWTVNISRSGVLFALDGAGLTDGEVEFVIRLSRGALQGPGVPLLPDLHCRGRIVRVMTGPKGESIVAASIRRQSLRRVDSTPARGRAAAASPDVSEPPDPPTSPPAP
jgi:hypothetical protein